MIHKNRHHFLYALLGLVLTLGLGACSSEDAPNSTPAKSESTPFVFTAIPDQDVRRLQERFGLAATYLQEQLGVPVEYVPVKSYSAAVTAFTRNDVQLAWFGGLSGVQARQRVPGARAIAQGISDPKFHSVFIAHSDAKIDLSESSLPDALRGTRFTFGSKGSTSGRLMPEFFLREHFKQGPEEIFERFGFSGDHTRTVQLVQSGAWQAGALSYAVWDKEVARGNVDPSKVKVIWRTPDYPDYHWTIQGDLDARYGAGFSDKLQAALLNLKDAELLSRFGRKGFITATNADYAPIEDTARSLGLLGSDK